MAYSNKTWKNEKDVIESWDQVSIFSKGQTNVIDMKIDSELSERKTKEKEAKRLVAELLQREKERKQEEEERVREDRLLEEHLLKERALQNSYLPHVGRGRGQLINNMRKRVAKPTLDNDDYIIEQVRKQSGYFGNDIIESYWKNPEGIGATASTSNVSSSEEQSSSAVSEGEFDDSYSITSTSESTENSLDIETLTRSSLQATPTQLSPQVTPTRFSPHVTKATQLSPQTTPTRLSPRTTPTEQSPRTTPTRTSSSVSTPQGSSAKKKSPRCRNALINALKQNLNLSSDESANEPASSKLFEAASSSKQTSVVEEVNFVYASCEKPVCASKFTNPSLYEKSFRQEWSSKNRKLNPSKKSKEFFEEFIFKKEDFPPL